jgi:TolB-like protein/tetratricopeptide (TPR) repeat protein
MNPSTVEVAKPATVPPVKRRTDSSGMRFWTAASLLAIAIGLGFGFWAVSRQLAPQIMSSGASPVETNSALVPQKSIAVLPFADLSDNKQNAFLADGVQDDILSTLSKIADLKVISGSSVSSYKPGSARNLPEIADALGVGYIVEGSVRQSGTHVSITAQLTDTRRSARLWTESYERDLGEVFEVQSEIAQRIVSQLQVQVSSKEEAATRERPTKDLAAYSSYVLAKRLIATVAFNGQIEEKLRQAIGLLEQAVARDPDFYLAYCQLSAAHDYMYFFGLDHTPTRLGAADAALQAVVRLRPDAAETHLARANFFYRCYLDYNGARAELALAQRGLPNNSQIFELAGYIDRRQGLWNESTRNLERAIELDPRDFFMLQQIALSYQEFRQFGAMAAALDRALAVIPRDTDTRLVRALVELESKANTKPLHETVVNVLAERPESATDIAAQWFYVALCERDQAAIQRALAAIPPTGTSVDLNFPLSFCKGLAARVKGDADAARAAFLQAREEVNKTVNEQPNYGPGFSVIGLIDAALGRKEDALREGRHAIELLPITKDSIDGAEVVKYLGVIYAWCGETDLAIEQIGATLRVPSTLSYGNLKLHPYWDPLRGDPRFEKIVADLAAKTFAQVKAESKAVASR